MRIELESASTDGLSGRRISRTHRIRKKRAYIGVADVAFVDSSAADLRPFTDAVTGQENIAVGVL